MSVNVPTAIPEKVKALAVRCIFNLEQNYIPPIYFDPSLS